MLNINSYNVDMSKFNFKFTTSSGDKIELNLYDNLEIDKSFSRNSNSKTSEMTLRHEYGYSFHYEGDGLDKNDIKEIKEAIKKIKPLFEKFLKTKKEHEKEIINFTHNLKSMLPKPKNKNYELAIKHHTLESFDEILKNIKVTNKELKKAKEIFDRLFENKFELIA